MFVHSKLTHNNIHVVISQLTLPPPPPCRTEVNVMGPVVGIAVVLTIVPLVLFTISSYCITGYIRDILFHGAVKCCVRSYCLNIAVSLYFHYLLTCIHAAYS